MNPEAAIFLREFAEEHKHMRDLYVTLKEDGRRVLVFQFQWMDEPAPVIVCQGCGVEKGDFNDASFRICSLCKYSQTCPSKRWVDNFFADEETPA